MLLMLFALLLAAFIIIALITMMFSVMARSNKDREKTSPFECGFDPLCSSRLPFSLQFFLLAIIFLVFDIEIALIIPLPLTPLLTSPQVLISSFFFLLILLLGLFHEWRQGTLTWA